MSDGCVVDGSVCAGGFRRRVRMSGDTRYDASDPARRTDRVPIGRLSLHPAKLPQTPLAK